MAFATVYEGTWDELASHADELRRYAKLTLIAPQNSSLVTIAPKAGTDVEKMIREMDIFTLSNQGLPHLPEEAFNRETLYGED